MDRLSQNKKFGEIQKITNFYFWIALGHSALNSIYKYVHNSWTLEWFACQFWSRLNNQSHAISWNVCLLMLPLSLNTNIADKKTATKATNKWWNERTHDHYLGKKKVTAIATLQSFDCDDWARVNLFTYILSLSLLYNFKMEWIRSEIAMVFQTLPFSMMWKWSKKNLMFDFVNVVLWIVGASNVQQKKKWNKRHTDKMMQFICCSIETTYSH